MFINTKQAKSSMGIERVLKAVIGLLLIVAALYLLVLWWASFVTLVLGGIPLLLGMIGLVFLLLSAEK